MADIEKNIQINVETQGATQNIESLNKQLQNTEKSVKEIPTSLKDIWNTILAGQNPLKLLQAGIKGVTTSLKALIATPVGAAITAIVVGVTAVVKVFEKLKIAIDRNDEAGTNLARALAILKTPLQAVERIFNGLAKIVGKVAGGFADYMEKVSGSASAVSRLVSAMDELEDRQRSYQISSAKTRLEIAKLRATAEDTTLSDKERLKARQRIFELEQADFAQQRKNIKKSLDVALDDIQQSTQQLVNTENWTLRALLKDGVDVSKASIETLNNYAKEYGLTGTRIREVWNTLSDENKDKLTDLITGLIDLDAQVYEAEATYNRRSAKFLDEKKTNDKKQVSQAEKTEKEQVKIESDKNKELERLRKENVQDARENWAKQHEDLTSALEVLSQDYNDEVNEYVLAQQKLRKENDEYAKLVEKTTDEKEKERLQKIVDTNLQIITEYDSSIENATNRYKNAVGKIIAEVDAPTFDFSDNDWSQQRNQVIEQYTGLFAELASLYNNGNTSYEDYLNKRNELTREYNTELEKINEKEKKETEAQEEEEARVIATKREAAIDTLGSLSDVMGSIGDMYARKAQSIIALGDKATAAQKQEAIEALENQKKTAIIQSAIQTAMAIGNAVVAATSASAAAGPAAPVVYASILASMIASIVGQITSAKSQIEQIDSQIAELRAPKKLATGGYVSGPGSATSDSIPARLSNGEAVINARSTAMYYDLLSKINQEGGGVAFPGTGTWKFSSGGVAMDMGVMIRAMKEAVSEIQPVVSVKEITNTQKRIAMKENR